VRFRVGATVCAKNVYSGGNFENGDIVTIAQIGNEDEPNCLMQTTSVQWATTNYRISCTLWNLGVRLLVAE